jgi:hypothetical protein
VPLGIGVLRRLSTVNDRPKPFAAACPHSRYHWRKFRGRIASPSTWFYTRGSDAPYGLPVIMMFVILVMEFDMKLLTIIWFVTFFIS